MNVTATLFGQMFTFLVLVWFVNQFLWGPMTKMMQERKARIADGLAAGERGKHELELAKKKAADDIRDAKRQAADILAGAKKQATENIEESKEQARIEGQKQLDAAKAEIEQERSRAREQLREEVVTLATVMAEKVLAREIDASAHSDFVKQEMQKI